MNHMVYKCVFTQSEGGLQLLHEAEDDTHIHQGADYESYNTHKI